MKIRLETSHEVKLHFTPKEGKTWEASAFVQPHVTIDCPALWEWLMERVKSCSRRLQIDRLREDLQQQR